jgi:hypothetical protein
MSIEIANPQQCTGWVVGVSATDLTYNGSESGQSSLPSSSLRVVNPDNSLTVLSGTSQPMVESGGGNAGYSLPVELLIPGGTAIGTYTSTVTVTTAAAPAG